MGRGGWSWYTGAASWSYRTALEGVLGFEKRGDRLRLDPCIPPTWPGFALEYRFGTSVYAVRVSNPHGVSGGVVGVDLDGSAVAGEWVRLVDDGARHEVVVILGHR